MASEAAYPSDIAFTPSVKAIQTRKGSRENYARMEQGDGWATEVTPALAAFIAEQNSIYVGSSNAAGQPYIQHRGGPPGFLRVLDEKTLAFADYKGNRQYVTQGNLLENPRAFIFLMDYQRRRRIKLWGTARIVEGDAGLLRSLMPEGYRAHPEQAFIFDLAAWDANCPQHIPKRVEAPDMDAAIAARDQTILDLSARVNELTRRLRELGGNPEQQ
jgi:predicted pyridoxine 5'-phosphate oxidase superfamily flavin-nucleotide-binding protein